MTDTIDDNADNKEYTSFEKKCMDAGWNPNGKKPAEDWALDGLSVRNEKITDLYKLHDNLKDLMSKQEQAIYDKAKAELVAERDNAIARGDVQSVKEIEKQEENLKIQTRIQSAVNSFINRNESWCKSNEPEHLEMQKEMKLMDMSLGPRGMSPEDHFAAIEVHLRNKFPEQFGEQPTKKRGQAVEGGRATVSHDSKRKFTFDDLSPQQKQFANMYEKQKLMTKEKYIDELVKAGALK